MAKQLPTSVPEIVELLKRFNEQASRLYAYSFHRQATAPGSSPIVQLIPTSIREHRGADEESTAAVACVLRILVQPRDLISFEQVVEMHESLPISDEQKRVSRGSLSTLQEYLSTGCSAAFSDWAITRAELFEVFLYGRYAHNNPDKVHKVKRLIGSGLSVIYQSDFEDIVLTYIEYSLWYKAFNERIIQSLK